MVERPGEASVAGPDAATDTPHPRRADIQGLRAVAVLLVVAYHAGLSVDGGFTGVDVFFVISGFVITALLMREVDAGARSRSRRSTPVACGGSSPRWR